MLTVTPACTKTFSKSIPLTVSPELEPSFSPTHGTCSSSQIPCLPHTLPCFHLHVCLSLSFHFLPVSLFTLPTLDSFLYSSFPSSSHASFSLRNMAVLLPLPLPLLLWHMAWGLRRGIREDGDGWGSCKNTREGEERRDCRDMNITFPQTWLSASD